MTEMAILQDVDKCVRCNGCVIACKREWNLLLPTDIEDVKPLKMLLNSRQRLAIKSQKRADMGPFMRYTCWHCYNPPCASACPRKAIIKKASGAVHVDRTLCDPTLCNPDNLPVYPCQKGCHRGGYPQVGPAYQDAPATPKMNKCTLCHTRAGADSDPELDVNRALPTRATQAEITAVPEKAHEPACVSTCPAKAMKWDTRANIVAYLEDPANGFILGVGSPAPGTRNWVGGDSLFWASKKVLLAPPKADPLVEDHIAPAVSSLISSGKLFMPTLFIGGLAALSARRSKVEASTEGEV